MHLAVLGLSRKLAAMTRKFIPKNYIINAETQRRRVSFLNTEKRRDLSKTH